MNSGNTLHPVGIDFFALNNAELVTQSMIQVAREGVLPSLKMSNKSPMKEKDKLVLV